MGKIFLICAVIYIIGHLVGAITHEADMARNYKKYDDCKAWFFDITRSPKEK